MRTGRRLSAATALAEALAASAPQAARTLAADPLGQLLVAIVVAGAVVLVGRLLLSLAWKLLLLAGVVVAVLYAVSIAGGAL
jgi:hypothetical protein